jgi:O-antigen/teichoic acid export membrane protein
VSQATSSATNFALSIVAAIALGPAGLGRVFIGFSFYLLVLGFQRGLIIDPLISRSSALGADERDRATRAALMTSIGWGAVCTVVAATASLIRIGGIGDGLALFVPWVIPALLQDFWRVVLFREGREAAAALNDASWAAAMGLSLPLAFLAGSPWMVVGTWGIGAVAGAILGFLQARSRPAPPAVALRWWRHEAWPFGRWLGAEGVVYAVGAHGLVFVLAVLLGTRPLGGLRAIQTIFAPLTLLGPAIALPGLPQLARATASSSANARKLALTLSGAALVLTGGYVLLASVGGDDLIRLVFGEAFTGFAPLFWPIAIGQLMAATGLGFGLLLKAQRRGRALLWTRVVGSGLALVLASVLALQSGVTGAAWGMAVGSAANAVLVTLLGLGLLGSGGLRPRGPATEALPDALGVGDPARPPG